MNGGLRAFLLVAILGGLGMVLVFLIQFHKTAGPTLYGATFSPEYARFLGLDDHAAFKAMLDELPIRQVRLPVQWDQVQPAADVTDFSSLDWYMDQAAEHNVDVILAIGNKVPRWPECHTPSWVAQLPNDARREQALLTYVDALVERYRVHPALERWQVENESLFVFGDCPAPNFALLKKEITHVRARDNLHPIQITVSGEQQFWVTVARDADVIGTSMYRHVALPNHWQFTFPLPPRWYSLQALSVMFLVKKVVISELQVEPWLTADYRTYTVDEAANLFTERDLAHTLRYARATGLREASLWGIEWWYYLKEHGHPELWDSAKELLKN